jgi:hypothetical protein
MALCWLDLTLSRARWAVRAEPIDVLTYSLRCHLPAMTVSCKSWKFMLKLETRIPRPKLTPLKLVNSVGSNSVTKADINLIDYNGIDDGCHGDSDNPTLSWEVSQS